MAWLTEKSIASKQCKNAICEVNDMACANCKAAWFDLKPCQKFTGM